jgi:carboxylesterase type B
MRDYWTRFARSGSPNLHGIFTWPRYTLSGDQRINLDVDLGVLTGFRRRECEFWWSVYDAEFASGSPSGAFVQ